tara:strand:+ start:47 stop:1495 length:1449 start_codon:yes stop_codon:yes gene_type:complete
MLGSLRKFSGSIYAKILLGIVIIPFVFWGMGSSLTGGSKNIIVVIENDKYSIEDFGNYVQKFTTRDKKISSSQLENLLSEFIGQKLMEKEIEHFEIKLSDNSLANLIKNQKGFKRDNKFSRIEYEKFLLENNLTAANFERNLYEVETKKQLLNLIGGGVSPPKFLVNNSYDRINQKRNIQLINLNDIFDKKIKFSNDEIKSYYEKNKNQYIDTHKSVKLLEIDPKRLIGSDEYNNLYFERIDEIDDKIMQGESFDNIIQKYNLENIDEFTFNKLGKEIDSKSVGNIPENLIKNILSLKPEEPAALIEIEEKYFLAGIFKTENVQKSFDEPSVKKNILSNLEKNEKRKYMSDLISKLNNDKFNKIDFDNLSKEENINIKKITLLNKSDDKILMKELVNEIYGFSEKRVVVINDINFIENYLVYIDKIEHVKIDENSEEYKKYSNLAKIKIANDLYSTYDSYIKSRYEIEINYQALETVKNYFN